MNTRGIYDRDGEVFGYVAGNQVFTLEGVLTGVIRDRVIYDLENERRWQIDGDALVNIRGEVEGYLGAPVSRDEW
ncbi:MAG: hypothetical protein GYB65_15825 [Chloroflexi bacterium]|nr:hypothetical protein [Chloroflexota bacterium]